MLMDLDQCRQQDTLDSTTYSNLVLSVIPNAAISKQRPVMQMSNVKVLHVVCKMS